jgi:nicotinamide-nucleotide amidase
VAAEAEYRVCLIATGEELTRGASVETNCAYMAKALTAHGCRVVAHLTLGDAQQPLAEAVAHWAGRCEAMVISGGLGPTADDRTRFALSRASGRALVEDAGAVAHLEAFFHARGRTMASTNLVQAQFPEGAEVLPNPVGTARGIAMEMGGCVVFAVPGVPAEMRRMFDGEVLGRILARMPARLHTVVRTVNVFGLPESEADARLEGLIDETASPAVGLTVNGSIIRVSVSATGADEGRLRGEVDRVAAEVRSRLGSHVFGEDETTLAESVVGLLEERGATVAVAESCTGGLVGHMLTNVPGVSRFFLEGVVAYSNRAKVELLGVPSGLIAAHGAVSAEVAEAMASGARARAGATLGVSTTGIAGPGGGTETKPVGLVYVAVADERGARSRRLELWGGREAIKDRAAKYAIDELRRALLDGADGGAQTGNEVTDGS